MRIGDGVGRGCFPSETAGTTRPRGQGGRLLLDPSEVEKAVKQAVNALASTTGWLPFIVP